MNQNSSIPITTLEALRNLDAPSISNAIETLNVRLRNEGFIAGAVRCRFPSFQSMVGFAVTGRIRSSIPPMTGRCYYDRIDFWKYLSSLPAPRVLVLQDVDPLPGFGAFVGEIHAAIALALDCIGCVTNGAVRDLPQLKTLGFHLFSGKLSVSHAYAHLIDFGEPVEIGGLKISPGDLLHGDCHGVQSIPLEIASDIPNEVEKNKRRESELIEFCQSSQFSLQGLEDKLRKAAADCL